MAISGLSSRTGRAALALSFVLATLVTAVEALAQDSAARRLEAIEVQPLPGQRLELRLRHNQAAPEPMSFTIDDPARIAIDLPNTVIALPARRQDVNLGPVTTILAAEANGRTRIVLNMSTLVPYATRVEGNSVIVEVGGEGAQPSFSAQPAPRSTAPAAAALAGQRSINNIDFRRGADGAGQVIVELNDPRTTVDVREEGGRVVVDFSNTELPAELLRRLDVTDFATPVATVDALRAAGTARIVVTPSGNYEQVAYQADNVFTLELKQPPEVEPQVASAFEADREYTGDPLTLTFQDLDTRAVLQLLADFSGLNIVVSDSVQGNVTLRLQDVPWDQALDIVMTTKGLDMRRNGNVVIVAPAEEIAAREQALLEARNALQEIEPLRSEFIQVNYAKAADLAELIGGGGNNALISQRGSVAIDERTNTLLVQDTADRLADVRRLVTTLDIAIRQVQIESRIVIVNDDYSRDIGVRFGATAVQENSSNGMISMTGTSAGSDTMVSSALANLADPANGTPFPVEIGPAAERYNVNLPIGSPAGSIALAILDSDYLIDLELSALQAEGNGEIVSTPRVIVSNNAEARITQGVEIPYQESSSSGATTTQFKEAVLMLQVTPQITPDDRIIMDLLVTKDSVGAVVPSGQGGFVPSIDTRDVQTTVLVNDGETVVLGGIYETENRDDVNKVPVLGDIPGLGFLFRSKSNLSNRAELLIFVTPRILREGVRLQ
jgi:type IV pilus assembly protein PilQ